MQGQQKTHLFVCDRDIFGMVMMFCADLTIASRWL